MEQHLHILQLCLPLLSPKDVAVMRCVCSDLTKMRVSWEAYGDIHFDLNGCTSSISWLHKNIASIKTLFLAISFDAPPQLLRGLVTAGRWAASAQQQQSSSMLQHANASDRVARMPDPTSVQILRQTMAGADVTACRACPAVHKYTEVNKAVQPHT
jgi:hypothetical protein